MCKLKRSANIILDAEFEEPIIQFLSFKICEKLNWINEKFKKKFIENIDKEIYEKIKDYNFEETIFEFLKKKGLL